MTRDIAGEYFALRNIESSLEKGNRMKESTRNHRKMVLLALASVALLTPAVRAQTITPQLDDLILGFYATGSTGETLNVEVDLGNISQFYNATGVFPLPALAVQDLVNTYGASWSTRTDLFWGAVSTTGRATGTADLHAPVGTLWATAPVGQAAFNRGSVFAQKAASPNIEAMIDPSDSGGSLYGATSTANSPSAAVIDAALADSWTAQDLKDAGSSFGYFTPTVDNTVNIPPGAQVVSDLYELQPTNAPGVTAALLGELILTQNGLSFQAGAVASAFQITSIAPAGGNVVITWNAVGIGTNVVQATNGGPGGGYTNNFQDISGPIIINFAGQTTTNYTDVGGATNRPSRFYRVRLAP